MKVSELQTIIRNEVTKVVKTEVTKIVKAELPKMVKPLVQEAVAGALASLLAEGIVKGPPAPKTPILTPNIPQARPSNSPGGRQATKKGGLDAATKRNLAEQLGYGSIDTIGMPDAGYTRAGPVNDILTETARSMGPADSVPSVLDAVDQMDISPEAVDAITRDYSDLMKAMDRRGKPNG